MVSWRPHTTSTESSASIEEDRPSETARLVRADQLAAIRISISSAIPVNIAIGFVGTIIAVYAGRTPEALTWYSASTAINIAACAVPLGSEGPIRGPAS